MTKPPRPSERRSKTRNLLFAAFFFVLGVIGVLIPVVPQVPFFIMSAIFLSLVFPKLRRAMRRWRRRYPKLDASYKKWRARARKKRQEFIRKHRSPEREVEITLDRDR